MDNEKRKGASLLSNWLDRLVRALALFLTPRTGAFISAALLITGSFLSWVDAPIGAGWRGYDLILLPPIRLLDYRIELSYGAVAFLMGLWGLLLMALPDSRFKAFTGTTCLALALWFFYHYTYRDMSMIENIVDQHRQYQNIKSFLQQNFYPNLGFPFALYHSLSTEDSFYRAFSLSCYLGWGWWFLVTSGFLWMVSGWAEEKSAQRPVKLRLWTITFIPLFALMVLLLIPLSRLEYHLQRGDAEVAAQEYPQALEEYDTTLRLAPQLAQNEALRLKLAEIAYSLSQTDKPGYYLHRAELLQREQRWEEAIFECQQAMERAPDDSVIRNHLAWLLINYGLTLYNRQSFLAAIANWQQALRANSGQIQAYFLMARAYFDVSNHPYSLRACEAFLKGSTDTILNANTNSLQGDNLYRMRAPVEGRPHYESAWELDDYRNFWTSKGLGGT